jgi:hypothetical protein
LFRGKLGGVTGGKMRTVIRLLILASALAILGAPFTGLADKKDEDRGYVPKEGIIPTKEVAIKVAEAVLNEIYGEKEIKDEKPFKVELKKGVWIIEGTLPADMVGGVAEIRISKQTGEVLYVMHGK